MLSCPLGGSLPDIGDTRHLSVGTGEHRPGRQARHISGRPTQQVIATIQQEVPGETLVCEEDSIPPGVEIPPEETLPESGPAWVVDPRDGTANYGG